MRSYELIGDNVSLKLNLAKGEAALGRDPSADLSITGAGVSRRHARVFERNDQLYVEDLNSSNGTFVNGQRINAATPVNDGDTIGLGQSVKINVRVEEPQPDYPPAETMPYDPDDFGTIAYDPDDFGTITGEEDDPVEIPPAPESASTIASDPSMTAAPQRADTRAAQQTPPAQYTPPMQQSPPPPPGVPRGGDIGATVMGDVDMSEFHGPPTFTVKVAGEDLNSYNLTNDQYSIGRSPDNDIVINSRIVSRYHGRLVRQNGGYIMEPASEAGNPVQYEGRPIQTVQKLRHGDMMRIGGMDPGLMVTMTYVSPAEQAAHGLAQDIDFGEEVVITIGRDPSNNIVVDSPNVSRFHAQLERVGQRYRITDLRSSNGTFVNDAGIDEQSGFRQMMSSALDHMCSSSVMMNWRNTTNQAGCWSRQLASTSGCAKTSTSSKTSRWYSSHVSSLLWLVRVVVVNRR